MLKATGLGRTAGGRAILSDVGFKVAAGGLTAVLGPSGSGKTTLLRLVMGLDEADAGDLCLDGAALSAPGRHVAPEQRPFSLVFQEFTLFPHLDVTGNIVFGLKGADGKDDRLAELLDLLEIAPLASRSIDSLSGGEQQRVALARALALRPRLLLLDEPFSNIDRMMRDRLYERFKAHLTAHGITTMLATHDHAEAFYFADRVLVLRDGRVIDDNTPRAVYHRPRDAWVAAFFGPGNILSADVAARLGAGPAAGDGTAAYLLRPEALTLTAADDGALAGTVAAVGFHGPYQDVTVRVDAASGTPGIAEGLVLRVRDFGAEPVEPGSRAGISLRSGFSPHPLPGPAGDGGGAP